MTFKEVETFILSLPKAKLDYPFGEEVAVYKVLIPDKTRTSHADAGQGGIESSNEAYKSTENEMTNHTDAAMRSKHRQAASSASGQDEALRGSWKMFALMPENQDPVRLSLKCDPQLAVVLRERYESVLEGYHLNKKHWNTILLTGQLSEQEVHDLIVHSYNLVSGVNGSIPDFA